MSEPRSASKTQRVTLWILQDGKCAICGEELPEYFEVDHLQPFQAKGGTQLWNLQALCTSCHKQKTALAMHSEKVNEK
jgi:5-methylcytosine-specific restriction endonuclease McrA